MSLKVGKARKKVFMLMMEADDQTIAMAAK